MSDSESLWDSLDQAEACGDTFREQLDQTESFPKTRWFDRLPHIAKPLALAALVSGGATGCSSIDIAANHSSLQQQAIAIDAAPVTEQAELAEIRARDHQPEPGFTEPVYTVAELADILASGPGALPDTVRLENPYVDGELIPVIDNRAAGSSIDLFKHAGITALIQQSINSADHSAYAANPNLINSLRFSAGMTDLRESTGTTAILLNNFAGTVDEEHLSASNKVAMVLYHELAHAHMSQEMLQFLVTDNALDITMNGDWRIALESHASIMELVMIQRQEDMDTGQFQKVAEHLRQDRNKHLYQDENFPYRPQKAIDALVHINAEHGQWLQSIPDSHVPFMVTDLLRATGYYQSPAEAMLEETLPKAMARDDFSGFALDRQLVKTLQQDPWQDHQLQAAVTQLETALNQVEAAVLLQKLEAMMEYGALPSRSFLTATDKILEKAPAEYPGIRKAMDDLVPASGNLDERMDRLAQVIAREAGSGQAILDEATQSRQEALERIREVLEASAAVSMDDSLSSQFAKGSGAEPRAIALSLIAEYPVTRQHVLDAVSDMDKQSLSSFLTQHVSQDQVRELLQGDVPLKEVLPDILYSEEVETTWEAMLSDDRYRQPLENQSGNGTAPI